MHPSHILRQSSSGDSFSSRYWHNQPGRTKVVIATTALIAATTLAYYWGYQDVDKRQIERERVAALANTGEKRR
ncbi:hypothetical protein EV363DRAFT_1428178 [Boletus edulis]|uniref:Uncharacterized protein n=1 Tax=Boletus edulis BED1 TaxID=1328754 RepID=A0AAD4GEB7_BOLED|nr:hypothetical protein EV363DRAFT_1428178 [Boletus edulis]KAF8439015.1 hypothetical protein L210DRAFT_940709 [Boletus edulis BED1]